MKTKAKIVGLDCPNCARNLQNEINKIDGVENASIEFVKNSLVFESEQPQVALEKIKALTKELEPQAKITEKQTNSHKNLIFDICSLAVGIGLGVLIFFCSMPLWAFWTIYVTSALLLGYKTYWKAFRLLCKGIINENLLITISVIGASVVSLEHLEGLMVIALYSIGKILESLAVDKSRKSIDALARTQPEFANLLTDKEEVRVSPKEVEIGSIIVVHAGEKVPIDGIVVNGQSLVNNQSLTGESVPVSKCKGEEILSGGILLDGRLEIKTTHLFKDSAISKIMDLVENATENKSKTETFISKITRWYTLGVVLCAVLVWGIVWACLGDLSEAFRRGLGFLVVSCPCAFAISVPLAYFSGLGNASKNGVLIKGSNFLDACSTLNMVAFDKTGTLTTGNFEIQKIEAEKGFSEEEVLFVAALGEQNSLHPLAKAITAACKKKLEKVEKTREIAGKGVEFEFQNDKYFVGRKSKNLKSTCVEVFKNDKLMGKIELCDTIKSTSFSACKQLGEMNVKCALLSGDNLESVSVVASAVGIEDVRAGLLPEQKFEFLENCKHEKQKVGYVGDGINDAPSLALADVGFSMGINGAPASIEASDIVIVDDNPQKIVTAIKVSRYTKKIVWENIALSAIIKISALALVGVGLASMFVAVLADVGVTLLAVLNSLRALYFNPNKKKNVIKKNK